LGAHRLAHGADERLRLHVYDLTIAYGNPVHPVELGKQLPPSCCACSARSLLACSVSVENPALGHPSTQAKGCLAELSPQLSCVCWRGCDAERTARSLALLSDHFLNGGGDAFPHTPYARRFHPLLPIVTEIYLCHASSCHEILRMETPGQDVRARARAPNSAEGSPRRHGGLCCCFHVGLGGPQGVRTHLARAHQSCPS
jgi:hypothetical protein